MREKRGSLYTQFDTREQKIYMSYLQVQVGLEMIKINNMNYYLQL